MPVGARGVQRRPGVRVEQVDVGAVADQDLQHVQVVVQHGLVDGGKAWKCGLSGLKLFKLTRTGLVV